jgi:hypothetical protein
MTSKLFQFRLWFGAALFGISLFLFFQSHHCCAQTSYYGPKSSVPGLVRIEIQIYDDPELDGVKLQEVRFNGQLIKLKPPGVHGYRGGGSFQLAPGNYELIWVVAREKKDWPRTVEHREKVRIDPSNVWVEITIEGETAKIL